MRTISALLAKRERALHRRLDEAKSERDSLFQAFDVARHDVAFERAGSVDPATRDPDLRKLDRASERVRRGIRRAERRMARLRRRAERCRRLARTLTGRQSD